MCTYTGAAAVLLCFLNLYAALRLVPLEYPTIQQGVDAAAAQDTVVLLAGDYVESVGLPCRSMIIAGEYIMSGDTGSITECRWRASARATQIPRRCSAVNPTTTMHTQRTTNTNGDIRSAIEP